jgi:hypothetical protein
MTRERKIKWGILAGQALMLTALIPSAILFGVWLP